MCLLHTGLLHPGGGDGDGVDNILVHRLVVGERHLGVPQQRPVDENGGRQPPSLQLQRVMSVFDFTSLVGHIYSAGPKV